MVLAPGTRLGSYEVQHLLGAGGMGAVYAAYDSRLQRRVALKLLTDPNRDRQPDRLLHEARAACSLNHPNVGTVYEVLDHDPAVIVMEFVDGRSLAEFVRPGGLAADVTVGYGIQIADALAHAHDRGLVHHDLKPANVMITPEGRVKVLDFGLATRLSDTELSELTRTRTPLDKGAVVGTLPYMAPEVLAGGQGDSRSDVWALGVLLYELATGNRPFSGHTSFELSAAILEKQPPAPGVPPPLAEVIRTCLAKDPIRRYQTAGEVRAALRSVEAGESRLLARGRWIRPAAWPVAVMALIAGLWYYAGSKATPPTPTVEPVSVAVLPLRWLGDSPASAGLTLGIPDAIITRLSGVRQLRVRPTNAILPFETTDVDPQRAGEALSTSYVLSGTAQTSDGHLGVSVQLVKVGDGASVWGQRYEVPRGDLLRLQDLIADQIVAALKIQLTAADQARLYRRYTQDAAAYEAYLRGRAALARYTIDGTEDAIREFEGALAHDPRYGLARAGLAVASAEMHLRFAPPAETESWGNRALEEARAALALDPELAETHQALAAVYRKKEFDWAATIQESRRALELNPNLELPHAYLAGAYYHLGLLDQAEAEANAALAVNPTNRIEPTRSLGIVRLLRSDFAEAVSLLRQVPATSDTYLAQAYYYQGEAARAHELLERLVASRSASASARAQATLASFLAAQGDHARAQQLVHAVSSGQYVDHHVAYSTGAAYAQLGQRELARRWLARAAESGFLCPSWYAADPLLKPLLGDAEFRRFLVHLEASKNAAEKAFGGLAAER